MPISSIACTAAGLIWSAGVLPAERTCTRPLAWRSSTPAAIWLRPALWDAHEEHLRDVLGQAALRLGQSTQSFASEAVDEQRYEILDARARKRRYCLVDEAPDALRRKDAAELLFAGARQLCG